MMRISFLGVAVCLICVGITNTAPANATPQSITSDESCWGCESEWSDFWGSYIHWDIGDAIMVKAPDGRHLEWGMNTC
jgi:hypothetical protein